MDKMMARYDLVEIDHENTEVMFTMNYSTKPAFMGALMKRKMAKFFFKMLIGLKYHLETSSMVTKQNIKEIQKEYQGLKHGESFHASLQMASWETLHLFHFFEKGTRRVPFQLWSTTLPRRNSQLNPDDTAGPGCLLSPLKKARPPFLIS